MTIRILWQLYFWLFVAINAAVFGITFKSIDFLSLGFSESVSYLSLPLGTIALFGFAYSVHIYKQWLWIAVVGIILLNDVLYGGYYFISETIKYSQKPELSIADIKYPLMTLSLLVPYWAGISLYAFSRKFWQTPNNSFKFARKRRGLDAAQKTRSAT